ncbi:MAG: hypothetical protein VX527_03590 [Planctomycetota bacterium]|nr:hypothetical protein [Planctomycetota bacterium]
MFTVLLLMLMSHQPTTPTPASETSASPAASPFETVVPLTTSDQFVKAGESYISPDGTQVVFQAIPKPAEGQTPDPYYSMYLATLVTNDKEDEEPRWSLTNIHRLSPEGSSNTCGWFNPVTPNRVIFASTIESPRDGDTPGYQRDSRDYRWEFPPEMRICEVDTEEFRLVEARTDSAVPPALRYVEGDEQAYQAECSISPDGRHLLYTSMESGDGDIFVKDLETGVRHHIVSAPGYDGGPFFSPDGRRICYRSDRHQDDYLQIFVGELEFNDAGTIVGLEREFQVTDNEHVNWAPFWHSSGRYLVYSTSEAGHHNYEVFIVDADAGDPATGRPARYGTRTGRVTVANGFDGLPAFDAESKLMIWTSQRNDGSSQLCIAEFPTDPEVFLEVSTPEAGSGSHD